MDDSRFFIRHSLRKSVGAFVVSERPRRPSGDHSSRLCDGEFSGLRPLSKSLIELLSCFAAEMRRDPRIEFAVILPQRLGLRCVGRVRFGRARFVVYETIDEMIALNSL